jgi:hypothetical protein
VVLVLLMLHNVLKCGAGEGCRRSDGPMVSEMKKHYTESRRKGISYVQ